MATEVRPLLPEAAIREARALIRDSRLWFASVLIFPLGLLYVARVAHSYQLRRRYPILVCSRRRRA